jgi:hypothetical protein
VINATLRPLYSPEREPLQVLQKAGWVRGPVWKGAENLASTGIRSPDLPVLSDKENWKPREKRIATNRQKERRVERKSKI